MALLDDLVQRYAQTDLSIIFREVDATDNRQVNLTAIPADHFSHLKEVSLAQWLLESARATSKLAQEQNNFAGLKWRSEMTPFANPRKIKVPSETIEMEFCQFQDLDKFLRGYWKFLTREPYKGLEENTFAPENFIGFIQSKGFAADISYISKVLNLLPEARDLLATASEIVLPQLVSSLQITTFPKEVEVGQSFQLEGTASPTDQGKKLSVLVDETFPLNDIQIGEDGNWEAEFIFLQAGDRLVRISLDDQSVEIIIKVSLPNVTGAVTLNLTGSVGSGGINRNSDVLAVKQRLHSLGYTFVGDPNSAALNTGFILAIKLFQSIIAGRETLGGDGRIDVGNTTQKWLEAANAPRWQTMPDSDPSISLINHEKNQTNDDHDFGTSWLADAILEIADDYHNTFRVANPGKAAFSINDVSKPTGGDTPQHAGHETGLMCDVRLPRTDGQHGGITWKSDNFDRTAARALIKAMRRQKLVSQVFFNDATLRGETFLGQKLCNFATGHDDHIHFAIRPPVRA
ncbi:MAG: muramidase (flagellum-specific) [Microcystis aeruginosa L211-07]|nr:muramidase (flagellum-specific) [Microcystis aeruginosa L211-07]